MLVVLSCRFPFQIARVGLETAGALQDRRQGHLADVWRPGELWPSCAVCSISPNTKTKAVSGILVVSVETDTLVFTHERSLCFEKKY